MKKIIFSPKNKISEQILSPPIPAQKNIPDWYKKTNMFISNDEKIFRHIDGGSNLTIKSCPPVYDAISCGYLITLPCDITFVDPLKYGHRVIWEVSWDVVTTHGFSQVQNLKIPDEYDKTPFKFEGNWKIKTPKQYSLLYTHPFYRFDLPFISATGIVDSDVYESPINIPFFIKKDFYGTIPMGTPIAQIIPIKRENWFSEKIKYEESTEFLVDKIKLKSFMSYKKRFWQRKVYK